MHYNWLALFEQLIIDLMNADELFIINFINSYPLHLFTFVNCPTYATQDVTNPSPYIAIIYQPHQHRLYSATQQVSEHLSALHILYHTVCYTT